MMTNRLAPSITRSLRRGVAGAALLGVPLAGCTEIDRALAVEDPDIIIPSNINSAEAAAALRIGTLARFSQATSGGESYWLFGGLLADEWRSSDTFVQRNETDQRNVTLNNANLEGVFRSAQRAYLAADLATRELVEWEQPAWQVGEMYVVQALIQVQLAEHLCNGIPFSTLAEDGTVEYGTLQTTQQVLEAAIANADQAIATATGAGADPLRVRRAAAVVKGRALLNLGRYAEAAAAVADVPSDFVAANEHSQTTRNNTVWNLNNSGARYTVSEGEGGNGINFAFAGDPRLPVCRASATPAALAPGLAVCPAGNSARPFDRATPGPFLIQLRWPTRDASAAWASGIEARLIEAEAQLQAGNAAWLATLNALRTTVPGLAPLADPGNAAGRVDLLFRERAFWLFSTGHRLGDLRRLVRQYGRSAESVFPTGTFFKGGAYGDDVNFPIPEAEQNNPEIPPGENICLDRNA